jgi:beta-lactamase superfamily II metal-dependent hydrolase
MVVDGGTEESGEALVDHIRTVYNTTVVTHVVCTHPDGDHSSGLRKVMESLTVKNLWTHVPWVHASRTRHMFGNENWTNERLSAAIQVQYPIINELTDAAILNRVPIKYPFQGEQIGPFVVAAPSLQRYERLLPQFRNTPAPDEALLRRLGEWIAGLGRRTARAILKTIIENRGLETLREGGVTSAENESSVVLYGAFPADNRSVLLTADAGQIALEEALDYLQRTYGGFATLGLLQVPHHGSRNNISPSILNRVIGRPLPEGQKRAVSAFVSASLQDEDHPRQVVVNAFDRRGVTVYPTHGKKLMDRCNTPARAGWVPAVTIPFATRVEQYD